MNLNDLQNAWQEFNRAHPHFTCEPIERAPNSSIGNSFSRVAYRVYGKAGDAALAPAIDMQYISGSAVAIIAPNKSQ